MGGGKGEGEEAECFGTSCVVSHVSSPRVRHVCISWDTVVKLFLPSPVRHPYSPRLGRGALPAPASRLSRSPPRGNPFYPSRLLPWERRAGRTWSTRAKLSAKLRKIVSDTSTDPATHLAHLTHAHPPAPLPSALHRVATTERADSSNGYGQADRREREPRE